MLFHQFTSLPLELQREVWQRTLDDELEPTVHVFRGDESEHHWRLPEVVDMDISPLMHVCHESRSIARKQLKFRQNLDDGTCLGACREFRPDLDAIYVSSRDWSLFFFEGFLDSNPDQAAALQHLALDARVIGAMGGVQDFSQHVLKFGGLRTVSIVFSEEGWVPRDHVPTGSIQYRLVDCAPGQTVWNAPAGQVKRRDMDPWEVIRSFEQMLSHIVAGNDPSRTALIVDETTGGFCFKIIPQNIVPKSRKHYPKDDSRWLISIFKGVRGLLL